MDGRQKPSSFFTPGWACDGPRCAAVVSDTPGVKTKESLEMHGWLVESVHGEVVRAWCPHCRRGRGNHTR